MDDAAGAYRWMAVLTGSGIFWSACRLVALWRWYGPGGFYPWKFPDERPQTRAGRLAALVLEHPGLTILLGIRGLSGAWTSVAALLGYPTLVPVTLLLVTTLVKKWRLRWISEEAEVMNTIILFPLAFHVWRPDDMFVAHAGLWFISGQVCLAYFGAGWSKLRAAAWTMGVALTRILDGSALRSPALAAALARRPGLGRLLCRATIALELLLPLGPLLPRPALLILLGAGGVFHVSIAVLLGLGSFMWAFLATYPALLFTNRQIAEVLW
jgi:hypothetical protein